ncbi:hypothetical protein GR211_28280 [Rhizobium leguminosarum]|uniref:hypothetical protein n=1 Tax=Rhizobium ruizarguesonis TaxID=2081791 RepID=UPI0013B8E084|nr:hypothetical protein [Rhizobium ruizarguesonis]NEJ16852.1 hypothetical protein [Rhizobium ruizarguesonis]NEK30773.1 hypothetical protein [Rhizobium ruizarguesonis]
MRQTEPELDLQEMAAQNRRSQLSKPYVRPDFGAPIIAKPAIQSAELLQLFTSDA